MKLKVDKTGVYLDGMKVDKCFRVDILKMDPAEKPEAMLHICVDEVDVEYAAGD